MFFVHISLLFQHLEKVIKAQIPNITSLINKTVDELESEMIQIGRPISIDAGVGLSSINNMYNVIYKL